jgi:hypothetical protein
MFIYSIYSLLTNNVITIDCFYIKVYFDTFDRYNDIEEKNWILL